MDFLLMPDFGLHLGLHELATDNFVSTTIDTGLRGHGGGGFPTGVKWGFARKSVSDP